MKEAGEAEKAIAISRNQYHGCFPAITVIVDGGWSKCCRKQSYNAKSGVAIIVGLETRKILYLGVRNKYCSMFNKATDGNIPLHHCFRNWDESSSAMETDIILKSFQESEAQHGGPLLLLFAPVLFTLIVGSYVFVFSTLGLGS